MFAHGIVENSHCIALSKVATQYGDDDTMVMVMMVIHVTVIERVIIVMSKIIAIIMFLSFSEMIARQVVQFGKMTKFLSTG